MEMHEVMRPLTHKPLTPALNDALIRCRFPQFKYSRKRGGWIGTLTPTAQSPQYLVRIVYQLNKKPKVEVIRPEIRTNAPHRFSDGSLCLYYDPDGSWHSGLHLAETIIPWTAEWLYFYEQWLATGQWYGPAAPHSPAKSLWKNT
jgi:hypothetical protein